MESKQYFRVMLGGKSVHADECFKGQFIGTDFGLAENLAGKLPDNWKLFNQTFIPVYLKFNPGKSKVTAGLACGAIWTVSKGLKNGDIVLCPNGEGAYYIGEISSDYSYSPNQILPHRRKVKWYSKNIERSSMSEALRNSTGSIGTISDISKHAAEIEGLMAGATPPTLLSTDSTIEDPSAFALEKHLEDFLVENWKKTELGKNYDIYEEDGELVGQQYLSDTGPIDILAISKDKKTLLVVELKKGRASDVVVGQILRYMGYVNEELAEENQIVKGLVIAMEDDQKLRRALSMTNGIDFYRYQVSFTLHKI